MFLTKSTPRLIAFVLMAFGVMIMAVGAVNWQKANQGLKSLDAVYQAQGVELSYNDAGQLVDRGETAGADAIMSLLVDDYQFPVNEADFDPNDPLVNTPSELMYQFATVSFHTLHGTQTITLTEDAEYNGEVFKAGTYEFPVDGRYWSDFDRNHPIEGPAREMAWTPTAHALLAELSAGTGADYQAGFAHFAAWRTVIEGLAITLGGFGLLVLAMRQEDQIEQAIQTSTKERVTV